MLFICCYLLRVTNSMVEYSAFNRLVPGSSPGYPSNLFIYDSIFNSRFIDIKIYEVILCLQYLMLYQVLV